MSTFAYETFHLGLRTTRRFLRVPANWMSIIFFPLIQLLIFSQLYQDVVQLPNFGGDSDDYLDYLAPGQVAFAAFLAVAWSAYGLLVEYRNGYMDKLRAAPIRRWSILAGETASEGGAAGGTVVAVVPVVAEELVEVDVPDVAGTEEGATEVTAPATAGPCPEVGLDTAGFRSHPSPTPTPAANSIAATSAAAAPRRRPFCPMSLQAVASLCFLRVRSIALERFQRWLNGGP